MDTVDWYFDFISPFSYLQAELLARDPLPASLSCKPVLFAGLLQHWGQLGPAEIEPKRLFTFRYCLWRAHQLGISMRMPPAHPFNPLRLLRLAIALGSDFAICLALFRFVFQDGHSTDNEAAWHELAAAVGAENVDQRIAHPDVKGELRRNGEEAIARGVFGVPMLTVNDQLFWGADATDMCRDYLRGDPVFCDPEMRRVSMMPASAQRRR
jgi:2-hydroxychromene-2-carboxylate isomerase